MTNSGCYTDGMEPTHQVSLTPEQLAAISAGGGFAHCEDPATHVHYHLIQYELPTVDDDYIRSKLAEAQVDSTRETWRIGTSRNLRESFTNASSKSKARNSHAADRALGIRQSGYPRHF